MVSTTSRASTSPPPNDGLTPTISASQPSLGKFVIAYQLLVESGAIEVLSIHVTEAMSGTLNSARVAAQSATVPVTLVDSGTASFGISCCAWAAADAVAAGATIDEVARIAGARSRALGSSFIVGIPQLAKRSGRVAGPGVESAVGEGIPVLSIDGIDIAVLDTVTTVDAAVSAMAD